MFFFVRSQDYFELFGSGCLLFVECVLARVSFAEIAGKLSAPQCMDTGGKQNGNRGE